MKIDRRIQTLEYGPVFSRGKYIANVPWDDVQFVRPKRLAAFPPEIAAICRAVRPDSFISSK